MTDDRRQFLVRGVFAGAAGTLLPAAASAFGRRASACREPVICPPVVCLEPIYRLHRSLPDVPISGPFPSLLRLAKLGDLIQVVVTYPLATGPTTPTPRCAGILTHGCPIFCPVGVYSSDIIPGGGKLNAFVKAVGLGTASFIVRVSMSDGSIRDVPFAFDVTL